MEEAWLVQVVQVVCTSSRVRTWASCPATTWVSLGCRDLDTWVSRCRDTIKVEAWATLDKDLVDLLVTILLKDQVVTCRDHKVEDIPEQVDPT